MQCAPTSSLVDADPVVQVTARRSFTLSEICRYDEVRACGGALHLRAACDKLLVGLLLLTLIRASDGWAAEEIAFPVTASKPDFDAPRHPAPSSSMTTIPAPSSSMTTIPAPFLPLPALDSPHYSTRDFRPREPLVIDQESRTGAWDDAPLIRETPVWQRLSEFRSHNRIRVLTLWEGGGGSVSLQAGRKGDPSLQWTSRLMNRGGATHGLLDRVLSTSLASAGRGLHLSPRASSIEPAVKAAKSDNGGVGIR